VPRHRVGKGRLAAGDPVGHLGDQLVDLGGDVGLAQQPVVVVVPGVDEAAVDAGQRHALKRHTGAAHDPGLHGAVVEVVRLTSVADLTSTMARHTALAQQQVGAHQHAAVTEGGFRTG